MAHDALRQSKAKRNFSATSEPAEGGEGKVIIWDHGTGPATGAA